MELDIDSLAPSKMNRFKVLPTTRSSCQELQKHHAAPLIFNSLLVKTITNTKKLQRPTNLYHLRTHQFMSTQLILKSHSLRQETENHSNIIPPSLNIHKSFTTSAAHQAHATSSRKNTDLPDPDENEI
jgi:hypothetical protein